MSVTTMGTNIVLLHKFTKAQRETRLATIHFPEQSNILKTPTPCETRIQYWDKDLHKTYITDHSQDWKILHFISFTCVVSLLHSKQNLYSLQCNLPKYSRLHEISCFMHIIKTQVFYMQISFFNIIRVCFTYANYCSGMSGSVHWSKFDQKCQKWWLKKYPVQIKHFICIRTCGVIRSKLADRSITVGSFHFVEVGIVRFSSMSTKTWNWVEQKWYTVHKSLLNKTTQS